MTTPFTERRLAVEAELAGAEDNLKALQAQLSRKDEEIGELSAEREQFELLGTICSSIERLDEMGAAELFWGEEGRELDRQALLERARNSANEFQVKLDEFESVKQQTRDKIESCEIQIENLNDALLEIAEQEERAIYDYLVDRDERELPYRPMAMPWSRQGDDENRFRKSLAAVFLLVFLLSGLINFWELPKRDLNEPVEIPQHLVELVKKQQPKPKPPEPKEVEKKEEKPEEKKEKKVAEKRPTPTPEEKKVARQVAESSGVLAFKDNFSDLLDDDVSANLGATAKLTNKGENATDDGSRDIVVAQAQTSSGGINTSTLSRNVGGGAGDRIGSGGVAFSRVESAIGTDLVAADRPLSDGVGPSRTDEEIQIVFDRYKATLYRIYNRELRKDPTLRGQLVLEIKIEPDGSVSVAKLFSSDMGHPELEAKIVARVKRFNFGPKEGVPAVTIRYPIDFLPAG